MRAAMGSLQLASLACLAVALPPPAPATQPSGYAWKRIALPGHGTVDFLMPSSWRVSGKRDTADLLPTIEWRPPRGDAFLVAIEFEWHRDLQALQLPSVLKSVQAARDASTLATTTREIEIHEINGEHLSGYYFSATAKDPAADWRHLTSGAAAFGDLLLTFSVESNGATQPEVAETLKMLQSARRNAPAQE